MRLRYLLLISSFLALFICGCGPSVTAHRQQYVNTHTNLAPETRDAILKGEVRVGMTKDEVTGCLGSPGAITTGASIDKGFYNYWAYGDTIVYFGLDGKVSAVKSR
jgi:hypothetical protein